MTEGVKLVPDNAISEKKQAEALSAAIDRLNQGLPSDNNVTEPELTELLLTARLLKDAAKPSLAPPPAILEHIVEQTADAIVRDKQQRRRRKLVAAWVGAAAAVAAMVFLTVMPPANPPQQLAKTEQLPPVPAVETPQPPIIASPVPSPPAAPVEPAPPTDVDVAADLQPSEAGGGIAQPPAAALTLPTVPTPPPGETMLALSDRKADNITIDAVSKMIRQVYYQGTPDEIILTQAPKSSDLRRSVAIALPKENKMAAVNQEITAKMKVADRNKVTVIIGDQEVTLEGALSREELLKLADNLTRVSVAK